MHELIRKILTTKVYEAAVETPLEYAKGLSEYTGNKVRLKREDLQPVFSFKLRGAYNKIAHLSESERKSGVIAASAGNHAQGVAYSASKLGIDALIVMPVTTPKIKIDAVKSYGAEVVLEGDSYSEAAEHCSKLVKETGRTYIHPFDDELIIAGQGTVADEILRQSGGDVDYVFIPVGGGGLIAGMAAFLKEIKPEIKVIGVEPTDSDAMSRSLKAGEKVKLDSVGIFADGVAVMDVGDRTFELCRQYVDDIVLVDTDEICSGIKSVYQDTRSIVEPAGALGVAGMKKYVYENGIIGKSLVSVNSGANINFERLRYVAERTRIGEKQEALFAITIPEEAGSLKRFCSTLIGSKNITEFKYRMSDSKTAHLFLGVSIEQERERVEFAADLEKNGFRNVDLTDNELAKTHVRYMVGGLPKEACDESIYRFWFPERPGALIKLLNAMNENWNISLFHYRAQGGNYGRILLGFQIPPEDEQDFQRFLDGLGYRYIEEKDNEAYKLFLNNTVCGIK